MFLFVGSNVLHNLIMSVKSDMKFFEYPKRYQELFSEYFRNFVFLEFIIKKF